MDRMTIQTQDEKAKSQDFSHIDSRHGHGPKSDTRARTPRHSDNSLQPVPSQLARSRRAETVVGKSAYCEIALRNATGKIGTLEKELLEMQSMAADQERRWHEAEAKAYATQRKAQDSQIRFKISDTRRKDAEEKTRALEAQITEAISLAQKSEVEGSGTSAEEANRFQNIWGVFDSQVFEENKKRVDAENRVHELMKKREEAEARCLEETERRVQADLRAKHEMRGRIDEEMRSKGLRSKLKDAEEKLIMLEFQNDADEKRKKVVADESMKSKLKQAQHSLSHAEQKRMEAERKHSELEQQFFLAEEKFREYENKLRERNNRIAELQKLLEQSSVEFTRMLEYNSKQLGNSSEEVSELQMALENLAALSDMNSSKRSLPFGQPQNFAYETERISAQEVDNMKLRKLQTLNADLEVAIREPKEQMRRQEYDASNLLNLNTKLEATVEELKHRLEQEECAKMRLHATTEELEDTVREQKKKLDQMNAFEDSSECRRRGDSLIALRVEENPLFRLEPVMDGLQRTFLSRPDSVTDDSQMRPREGQESTTCQSQQISFLVSCDSEADLMESPKSDTEDRGHCLYHQEKQSILQKLRENEILIIGLRESIHEGHLKRSEMEIELKAARQSKEAADIKAAALVNQLELVLQREKERDREFAELSGTASFRGKKEKWGILDRFRSKIKLDIA